MNLEVPVGLTTLLQDFCVAVLRERPNDLVQFAADYFQNLNSNREASQGFRGSSTEQDRTASPIAFRPGQPVSDDEDEGISMEFYVRYAALKDFVKGQVEGNC